MKRLSYLFLLSIINILLCSAQGIYVNIPLEGNAYMTSGDRRSASIGKEGITKWHDANAVISSWFKVSNSGDLTIAVKGKVESGKSKIKLNIEDKSFTVELSKTEYTTIPVGTIKIKNPGYIRVDIQGEEKAGTTFADISDIVISGPAAQEPLYFVRDFSTYWGRRGPSVHLKYNMPEEDTEYFYNEITVPEGDDVIGSYYMANGFGEGYFGIQANSPTERRVLFSVWSPYETQNPKDIPVEYQVKKLRQGEGVHIGEFGNEGSGGQSYLIYPWKVGNTYKFLAQVRPDGKGNTVYTAYFYAADENRWRLIASFMRPKTDTWYKGAHSFLENFIPTQGYLTRKVIYTNQWAMTAKGEWVELTNATFTHDATAKAKVRMDYAGGLYTDGKSFFLQNCGFFDNYTEFNSKFTRPAENKKPEIDFEALKKL